MSAELIEQGAPRCGECGVPLVMHHDPGCSQPCGACARAKWRAQIHWLLMTSTLLSGVISVFLSGVAVGAGDRWGVIPFAAGLIVIGLVWVLTVRRQR